MYSRVKKSKIIRPIFFLSILLIVIVNMLQLYLLYASYQDAKNQFETYVNSSLFGTVMKYFQIKSDDSAQAKQSPVYVVSAPGENIRVDRQAGNSVMLSANAEPISVDTLLADYARDYRQYEFTKQKIDFHLLDSLYKFYLATKPIHSGFILDTIISRGVFKDPQVTGMRMRNKKNDAYPAKTNPYRLVGYSNIVLFAQLKTDYGFIAGAMVWKFVSWLLLLLASNLCIIFIVRIMRKESRLIELKNDFINNMTHELQTPITIAAAGLDAISLQGFDDHEKLKKYIDVCKTQLVNLHLLADKILRSSDEEKALFQLKPEELSLNALFEVIMQNHLLVAGKKINFEFQPEERFSVTADKTHLANALNNIIDNAIKYSGAEVTIAIGIKKAGQHIIINIKDNGIGIPETFQPLIFDKFFRIPQGDSQKVKGFGLGLSYVKNIIERHKGKIEVQSGGNNGTLFTISLPIQ